MPPGPQDEFARIATCFRKRRERILSCWRLAVEQDPELRAPAFLARAQFIDHIPRVLDGFEHALLARGPQSEAAAETEERVGAAEHGEDRWLQGYDSRQTLRELGHLHVCMLGELDSFAGGEAAADATALGEARIMLAQLFANCMVESAARHAELEKAEAEGRLSELERVVEQLRTVERERTELWREAAHDLRGNVGAVRLAASALGHAVATPELPAFVNMVRRSADSLDTMLNDLIELARLQAGREQLNVVRFNACTELAELCESLQPLATSHRLFLDFDAPPALVVDGDAVKVRRIAQNLVLNALKYTERGGVHVSCGEVGDGPVLHWFLSVQDTGDGLDGPTPIRRTASAHPGEGVGLSIVKRLCKLLDAHLELETQRGQGTTFRIIFPRRYSA